LVTKKRKRDEKMDSDISLMIFVAAGSAPVIAFALDSNISLAPVDEDSKKDKKKTEKKAQKQNAKNEAAAAFGSYGWSGEAPGIVENVLRSLKLYVVQPHRTLKFYPEDEKAGLLRDFGKEFARALTGAGDKK